MSPASRGALLNIHYYYYFNEMNIKIFPLKLHVIVYCGYDLLSYFLTTIFYFCNHLKHIFQLQEAKYSTKF